MSGERAIRLDVEVVGTPEQVWEAIATGAGITSWFVPSTVEEGEGGATTSTFGPSEEMHVAGRVRAWDPPRRVVFESGGADATMAFEWVVEARDGGSCVVRLVNSGFGSGAAWDDEYDGMEAGWRLFLHNLQLHLAHFAGQPAVPVLVTVPATGGRDRVWSALTERIGFPAAPVVGERAAATGPAVPPLTGTIERVGRAAVSMVIDDPVPGTAIVAVEGAGDQVSISVWLYLYGPDRSDVAARDEPAWRAVVTDTAEVLTR